MRKHILSKVVLASALLVAFGSTQALADHHEKGGKGSMFEKHDTDGDGSISKDEFLSHAEERFSKMDADGDGNVSKDEAKAAHEKMREKMKERMEMRQKAAE